MDSGSDSSPGGAGPAAPGAAESAKGAIDIQALARKVQRLFEEELRLERDRGAAMFGRRA
jgi:hypothetical protein